MSLEALKLELIEWLTNLDDEQTMEYLKVVKDSRSSDDWWDEISDEEKAGIQRGLDDVKAGRTLSHDEVKAKYGL